MINTSYQALEYLTECTLATISHMHALKSKSKSEFNRQIGIAQKGIDFLHQFMPDTYKFVGRVKDVIEISGCNVKDWVNTRG